MTDKEYKTVVGFTYINTFTGEQASASRTFDDECAPWDELLIQYMSFLSGCYGYDISKSVVIKPHDYTNFMTE